MNRRVYTEVLSATPATVRLCAGGFSLFPIRVTPIAWLSNDLAVVVLSLARRINFKKTNS